MSSSSAKLSVSLPAHLAKAVRRRVGPRGLSGFVAQAVAHERVDVQERALTLIEQYKDEPESTAPARAVLLGLAEAASPTLRARVSRLTGFALESVAVPGDRGRLEQVLSNLLSNAMKFGAAAPSTTEVTRPARPGRARAGSTAEAAHECDTGPCRAASPSTISEGDRGSTASTAWCRTVMGWKSGTRSPGSSRPASAAPVATTTARQARVP